MNQSVKTKLSEFFRSKLVAITNGEVAFFVDDTDEDTNPPYSIITVIRLDEIQPFTFRAEIKISVISSIDQSTSEVHDALLERVLLAVRQVPYEFSSSELSVYGWNIIATEPINKEESQSYIDEIMIVAGCAG